MWDCLKCGHENKNELPRFGDDAVCEKCGAVHETDWDYTDPHEGCMATWVTKLKGKSND
jgi:uncharacterized Zn finger protein